MTAGVVVSTRHAAQRAAAQGIERTCNGSATNSATCTSTRSCSPALTTPCRPRSTRAGSSASRLNTIGQQLSAGRTRPPDRHPLRRALLVPPARVRTPPSCSRTAQAAQVVALHPARSWSPRSPPVPPSWPPATEGGRHAARIYLCHNYCEFGAVRFSSVLGDVKTFLESHPDDVVILDIQDATSPADTAAGDHCGGAGRPGSPCWRGQAAAHAAGADRRRHQPRRLRRGGRSRRPGLVPAHVRLVPGDAVHLPERRCLRLQPQPWDDGGTAAAGQPLGEREGPRQTRPRPPQGQSEGRGLRRAGWSAACGKRGRMPNIIAVDFAGRGDLVATVDQEVNDRLVELIDGLGAPGADGHPVPVATTVAAGTTTTGCRPAEPRRPPGRP